MSRKSELLRAATQYKVLVTELKTVPLNNHMKRKSLGSKIADAARSADFEAEILHEWLEDAKNTESSFYTSAATLFSAYKQARESYRYWLNNATNANLARMRADERILFQVVDALNQQMQKRRTEALQV